MVSTEVIYIQTKLDGFIKKYCIYLYMERERERERETNQRKEQKLEKERGIMGEEV